MPVNRKPQPMDLNSMLKQVINNEFNDAVSGKNTGLVDVLTFVEEYLGVKMDVGKNARPYLKLILKMFYMNTPGNENLKITDADIDLIKRINNYSQPYPPEKHDPDFDYSEIVDYPNGNPWLLAKAEKLRNGVIKNPFHTLVLVLGRRSGKTFCSALIIAYEVYKFLVMCVCPVCEDIRNVPPGEYCPVCKEEGLNSICQKHPQAYYGLRGSEPLRILLAATRLGQAIDPGLMFFKERVRESPFFDGRYTPEAESVFFLSDYDKKINERLRAQGLPEEKGSIKVMAVASNPNGLHGLGSSVVLLDEFALFNSADEGRDTDSAFLEALMPQVIKYRKKHNDGRIIMISMPDKEQGKFFEFYAGAKGNDEDSDGILMMQMPTWEYAACEYTREECQKLLSSGSEKGVDGISFHKLFGAQFLAGGSDCYFDPGLVDFAFENHGEEQLWRKDIPTNRHHRYFMHIDCAFNSDEYACMICHMERRYSAESKKMEPYFVEDYSYSWRPIDGSPGSYTGERGECVNIFNILKEIADRAKAYRVASVSYDTIQSMESLSYFRSRGLTLRQLSFAGQNKGKLYKITQDALVGRRIILCHDDKEDLGRQMKGMRVKFTRRGPVIEKGTKLSDDKVDCLVGAIYMSNQKISKQFPRPISIMTGVPNLSTAGNGMLTNFQGHRGGMLMGSGQSLFTRFNAVQAYNGGYS
jgi:hypothetical protein